MGKHWSPTSSDVLMQALQDWAAPHGARLVKMPKEAFPALEAKAPQGYQDAPFTNLLGQNWAEKELFYHDPCQWPEAIHELGHMLACTDPPRRSDEWQFFGWEIAMVHHIGAPLDHWIASNQDYAVGKEAPPGCSHLEVGSLNPVELHHMMAERLQCALTLGLLTDEGTPRAIR